MIMHIEDYQLLFRENYKLNDSITIRHPTLDEIFDVGEREYMSVVSLLTASPKDYRSQLFDIGIDFEEINDFELFLITSNGMGERDTGILFEGLNFKDFVVAFEPKINQNVLVDLEKKIVIDRATYENISEYIRKMHGIQKDTKVAGNKHTKKVLTDLHRQDVLLNSRTPYKSTLCPLISSMVNSAGFKYNYETVLSLTIYKFMDALQRIQKIKGYEGLMSGMYSGNIDIKKIQNKDEILNWMG